MTYTVRPRIDWFRHEEASAVLIDDHVVVLSELATALVESVGDNADLASLTGAMLARFGAPPDDDPERNTKAALDELVRVGVLEERR
jgi:hypothetical protein